MKIAALTMFIMFTMVLWRVEGRCGSLAMKPLLGEDTLAEESRGKLAGLLYQRGVETERSGNLADALRHWLNAYNIDTQKKIITDRFIGAYEILLRAVNGRYREALFDLQYGRVDRAMTGLKGAYELLDNIDPEMSGTIAKAMEERDGQR